MKKNEENVEINKSAANSLKSKVIFKKWKDRYLGKEKTIETAQSVL